MNCQMNTMGKIACASLPIFTSGVLLFTSACSESGGNSSTSKELYENIRAGFSISTDGFEVNETKWRNEEGDSGDCLRLTLSGTEINI